MAIITKDYKYLWNDLIIRKGKNIENDLHNFLSNYNTYNEAKNDVKFKMKWMLYRLDQDLRAFIFKYVEVVEKSFKSILQEKYGPQVLDPNLQLRFSHICCSITNKCSDKIKNELIEKLNQKNLPFIKISETNVKKMQKEMYIFQGDCFYPNKDKFNQIVNFRNQIQHFDFILPTIIKDEDKIFKYFFKQFNIHYRHSLALNFLAALLKRMTTDFDNFSKQILNDLTILFPLTENITQNTEWQKLTKARYHDCVTYGNYELKYKDYYEEANKLWNDPAKGKSLYNQKKDLSIEISEYINDYINHTTICYRQSLEKTK